jgi:hypothetical protein
MISPILEEESKYYRRLDSSKDFISNMDSAVAFTLTRIDDKWEEVVYYGDAWLDPTEGVFKPHFVYVLVNPSLPGICKIGFTKKTVHERCRQINTATGVIIPWYPVYVYKCPSGPLLEKEVHQYLENQGKRIRANKEGFEISATDAIKIIEELGKKFKNKQEDHENS